MSADPYGQCHCNQYTIASIHAEMPQNSLIKADCH